MKMPRCAWEAGQRQARKPYPLRVGGIGPAHDHLTPLDLDRPANGECCLRTGPERGEPRDDRQPCGGRAGFRRRGSVPRLCTRKSWPLSRDTVGRICAASGERHRWEKRRGAGCERVEIKRVPRGERFRRSGFRGVAACWAYSVLRPVRCSRCPARKAPATSAPTTTSAKMASASAMPVRSLGTRTHRSVFRSATLVESVRLSTASVDPTPRTAPSVTPLSVHAISRTLVGDEW